MWKDMYGTKKIDVLFIDAGHTHEEVKADIEAWLPHMAGDGLILGHDYSDEFPGVKTAVQEAFHDFCVTVVERIWAVRCGQIHIPATSNGLGQSLVEHSPRRAAVPVEPGDAVRVPNARFEACNWIAPAPEVEDPLRRAEHASCSY